MPRPPIQLTVTGEGIRALGVDDSRLDPTDKLERVSSEFSEHHQLDAYIFKSRSPSCGLQQVPLLVQGEMKAEGRGVFAASLLRSKPGLVVIEEKQLVTVSDCEMFLQKVHNAIQVSGTGTD